MGGLSGPSKTARCGPPAWVPGELADESTRSTGPACGQGAAGDQPGVERDGEGTVKIARGKQLEGVVHAKGRRTRYVGGGELGDELYVSPFGLLHFSARLPQTSPVC
jgi:hypothetical protein